MNPYNSYQGDAKVSAAMRQSHPQALQVFKDACVVEFLGLPVGHSELEFYAQDADGAGDAGEHA